jgi:hypothetical protein
MPESTAAAPKLAVAEKHIRHLYHPTGAVDASIHRMRALASWLLLAGCATATEQDVTLTSATVEDGVATNTAAMSLAREQCTRAQACGAVSSRGVYLGEDHCETDTRAALDDLRPDRCPRVSPERLAACLAAVRDLDCTMVAQSSDPPIVCTRDALCLKR